MQNQSLLPTTWAMGVVPNRNLSGAHAAAELMRSAIQMVAVQSHSVAEMTIMAALTSISGIGEGFSSTFETRS
jgi:hypothetical protein